MKKPKASEIKQAVVLSDLHIGSTVGLWPEGFTSNEGVPVGQNDVQKWLYEKWHLTQEWIKQTTNGEPYALILNGDLVEGIVKKSLQVMTADTSDQVTACLQVLEHVITKAAKTYIVLGTETHTRNDEYRIGAVLKTERDPNTGMYAFTDLHLSINGCYGVARHHIGTAGSPYLEAGGLGRAMNTEIMEAARSGQIPRWFARAHRHRHGVVKDGNALMVVTGGWQLLTRFGHKVVPAASCQPSAVILDWRNEAYGALPQVHEHIHETKPKTIITL